MSGAAGPTIHARFGLRGAEDVGALFAYVHELVLREGTEPRYQLVATGLHMLGWQEASEPAAAVAGRVRGGAPVDELSLPRLRDPARVASADLEGVTLTATSVDWLADEHSRWLMAGGPADRVSFFAKLDLAPARSAALVQALRALGWLIEVVGATRLEARWYEPGGVPHQPAFQAGPAPAAACPSCRATHAPGLCEALLRGAPVAGLDTIHAAGERGAARWAAGAAGTTPHVFLRAPDARAIGAAFERWRRLEAPWDVEARRAPPAGPMTLEAEVRFDEATERAQVLGVVDDMARAGAWARDPSRRVELGAPGELRLAGDDAWVDVWLARLELALRRRPDARLEGRRPADVRAPGYLLLFVGLTWLSEHAGEARALRVSREGAPELALPLDGPRERCARCGGRHPRGLCEALVAAAGPSDVVALEVTPGGPPGRSLARLALRLRPVAEASARGDRAALAPPLDAWARLERAPWDPPPA